MSNRVLKIESTQNCRFRHWQQERFLLENEWVEDSLQINDGKSRMSKTNRCIMPNARTIRTSMMLQLIHLLDNTWLRMPSMPEIPHM